MINKILSKYTGWRNYWYPEVKEETVYNSPEVREILSLGCREQEANLLNKWKSYIPQGWYGFSLGEPCPAQWYVIIDEFLEYLKSLEQLNRISNLEIHQIKIKFGGIRFYVGYGCEDEELREHIQLQIDKIEDVLHDAKLIY
jgi:hypothetical protein